MQQAALVLTSNINCAMQACEDTASWAHSRLAVTCILAAD